MSPLAKSGVLAQIAAFDTSIALRPTPKQASLPPLSDYSKVRESAAARDDMVTAIKAAMVRIRQDIAADEDDATTTDTESDIDGLSGSGSDFGDD